MSLEFSIFDELLTSVTSLIIIGSAIVAGVFYYWSDITEAQFLDAVKSIFVFQPIAEDKDTGKNSKGIKVQLVTTYFYRSIDIRAAARRTYSASWSNFFVHTPRTVHLGFHIVAGRHRLGSHQSLDPTAERPLGSSFGWNRVPAIDSAVEDRVREQVRGG